MKSIKIVKKLQKIGKFSHIIIEGNSVQAIVSQYLGSDDLGHIYDEFHESCSIQLIAESDDLLLNIIPKSIKNNIYYDSNRPESAN